MLGQLKELRRERSGDKATAKAATLVTYRLEACFSQHNRKLQPIRRPEDKLQDECEVGQADGPVDGSEDEAEDEPLYKQEQLLKKKQPTCSKCHIQDHKEAQNAALCEIEAAHEIGKIYNRCSKTYSEWC